MYLYLNYYQVYLSLCIFICFHESKFIFKFLFFRIDQFESAMISISIKSLVFNFGLVLAFGNWGEYTTHNDVN